MSVYRIDRDGTTLSISFVDNVSVLDEVRSMDWSADGNYVVVSGSVSGSGGFVQTLKFDRAAGILSSQSSITLGTSGSILAVQWSPDGRAIISEANVSPVTFGPIQVYSGISFPSKNVIKNNTVYCNSGGECPSGVGISGSSVANMIIGNTSYSNPIPSGSNNPIVSSNYQFVTNVFNQLFGQVPSDLQNISLDGCDPICTPEDIALLIKQTLYKVCTPIPSQLDVIESKIDNIGGACDPTAVTAAGTISSSGIYCVANEISGALTIAASNVYLDLNNYRITDGITANGGLDQITIRNGVVEGSSDAIVVNGGTTNVTIDGVTVKNATRGINFDNVTGGMISNCEMTLNTTGLELDNSHKIVVKDCVAACNTHAGYCLLSSTTCCVLDSKALSTGEGNVDTENTVIFGFVSADGHGNIFERCIANSTQGLTVTDCSPIAGIALRGSEKCSKIISCEAANSTSSTDGFTVPHGILLEGRITGLNQVQQSASIHGAVVKGLDWHPLGRYLALAGDAGTGSSTLRILEVDYESDTASAIISTTSSDTVALRVKWSPCGRYLAVLDGTITGVSGLSSRGFTVFAFDSTLKTLTLLDSVSGFNVVTRQLDWSPDGNYIVTNASATTIDIYPFNRTTQQIEAPTSSAISSQRYFAWSPDGTHIVAGSGTTLNVYLFNENAKTVSLVDSDTANALTVKWSYDGKYIVAALNTPDALGVFSFSNNTIALEDSDSFTEAIQDVDWSPDGKHVVGIDFNFPTTTKLLAFDRMTSALTLLASTAEEGFASVWSPDGTYITIGQSNGDGGFRMYEVMSHPQKNVIKDNTVYCNSGNECPGGVGISGSSIQNMIIGNTAYNNPSNYLFVTNVFNQLFGQAPSDLQNVALDGCDPLAMPEDIPLLIKQVSAKLACTPTILTSADVSSGAITISSSGNYCLATDLTADINITATCVSLDLNNRCLTGEIDISTSNNVIVKNGFVTPAAPSSAPDAAITVASTSNRVQVDAVKIVCADTSIDSISGRAGVELHGNESVVINCSIKSGAGGRDTGNGGHGIIIGSDANKTIVKNTVIMTGKGGDTSATLDGGDGGRGIVVESAATGSEISFCTILCTGEGGACTNGTSGDGGDGGHGIFVDSTCVDTSIWDCVIRNTGAGGSSVAGAAGADGKAIDDNVTTSGALSLIYRNAANNIANTIKFDLQAAGSESGVLLPNPPTATVVNSFANVYAS